MSYLELSVISSFNYQSFPGLELKTLQPLVSRFLRHRSGSDKNGNDTTQGFLDLGKKL